jgi:limonene-1,2-epoxide hydrolase
MIDLRGGTMSKSVSPVADFVARFESFWKPPVDPDRVGEVLADDARLVTPGMPPTQGLEEAREGFRRLLSLWPDFHITVNRWSARDDIVFIEIRMHVTIGGTLLEIPAVDRFTLRDGKGVERVSYFDPAPLVEAMARGAAS